jgi:hypothetical protein
MAYRHVLVICDGSCDAIMLPAPRRRRLGRPMARDRASALRRRAHCTVLQPR